MVNVGVTASKNFWLSQEYESGSTPEAEIVKDLDKFDMVCQAFEYEQGIIHCRLL